MMKAVVALSGGLDSAVMLARMIKVDIKIARTVCIRYGSKHGWLETVAAAQIAEHYGVKHSTIDMREVFGGFASALIDPDKPIPEGHYEEESMRDTVVPFRNGIIAAVLAGLAESLRGEDDTVPMQVALATHAGDHHIYPDCRPAFNGAMNGAIILGTDQKVELFAPFEEMTKVDIVKLGIEMAVPFGMTRTCYTSLKQACGVCGSCQERLAAFKANGIEDPLDYATREILPKKV